MASLTGQTIASSYEQLLHTDTDGGLSTSLVAIKDGDNGVTSALLLAQDKVEVKPSDGSGNSTTTFEVSQYDGTAILNVNSTTPGVTITGTATISGVIDSNDATDSSSITTGSVKIAGGVGIEKKLFVGTDLDVDGATTLDNTDIAGTFNTIGAEATAGFTRHGADAAGEDSAHISVAVDSFAADAAHNFAQFGVQGNTSDGTSPSAAVAGGRASSFFINTRQHSNTTWKALNSNTAGTIFFNNGANNIHDASDIALKKDISTISGALDKINALRGIRFKWKTESERFPSGHPKHQMLHYGFVAQEVEEVVPELVSGGKTTVTDTETGESREIDTHKTIQDANEFSAILVEAVKELSARVTTLEG